MKATCAALAIACAAIVAAMPFAQAECQGQGAESGPQVYFTAYHMKGAAPLISSARMSGMAQLVEQGQDFTVMKGGMDAVGMLRRNGAVVEVLQNYGVIKFPGVSFRTDAGEPAIPSAYRAVHAGPEAKDYYVVQLKGPPLEEWIDSLQGAGCEIADAANYYAYIVRADAASISIAIKAPFVKWAGEYHPWYRLGQGAAEVRDEAKFLLIFYPGDGFWGSIQTAMALGARICSIDTSSSWDYRAVVEADASLLPSLAALQDLCLVETCEDSQDDGPASGSMESVPALPQVNNDFARWVIQSGINGSTPIWDHGLHGEGIVVGIGDTGIDYDHINFRDTMGDRGTPGPAHRKIVRYWAYSGDGGDDRGHGTHVSGIVAGDSIAHPGEYDKFDGNAFAAKIAFVDCMDSGFVKDDTSVNIQAYYQDAANYSANSHTDSWKAGTSYSSVAQKVDQYCWDHPTFLPFKSAGNYGGLTSPGNAKSICTVGATFNAEASSGLWNDTDFGFSSGRGPTGEGVRKPDIVVPGGNIWSAEADYDLNSYNSTYVKYSGTSMASPCAAAAAALVEQYFKEGFYPAGTKNVGAGFLASGPLRKAILVNSGTDIPGADAHVPDNSQGWGRVTLDYSLYFQGDSRKLWIEDSYNTGTALTTGQSYSKQLQVGGSEPLKVSLVWFDYPGAGLRNNLNLVVTGPSGQTYIGSNYASGVSVNDGGAQADSANPIECVHVPAPQAGTYTVTVNAASISSSGGQKFALVATGDLLMDQFYVSLASPQAGSVLQAGNSVNIQWSSANGKSPVSVDLSWSQNGGGSWSPLATGQPESGQWAWSVPLVDTTHARVKAVATDGNSTVTYAQTGDFTITTAVIPEMQATAAIASAVGLLGLAAVPAARSRLAGRRERE